MAALLDGAQQDVESNQQIQDCSEDSQLHAMAQVPLQGQVAFVLTCWSFHDFNEFAFVQIDR